jgi:hypothetical protein
MHCRPELEANGLPQALAILWRERSSGTHWIRGYVGCRAAPDTAKKDAFFRPFKKFGCSVVQPVLHLAVLVGLFCHVSSADLDNNVSVRKALLRDRWRPSVPCADIAL